MSTPETDRESLPLDKISVELEFLEELELQELSAAIDCQVQINLLERESFNDVYSFIQEEIDEADEKFTKMLDRMEMKFVQFTHEAHDIILHIMADQLSFAEMIGDMLKEAELEIHPTLHLDNSSLKKDFLHSLTMSDGLVALQVSTISRELAALTSFHGDVFDDVIAIERKCQIEENEMKRRGVLERLVDVGVESVLKEKAERRAENLLCEKLIEPGNVNKQEKKTRNNPLRSFARMFRSAARRLFSCGKSARA